MAISTSERVAVAAPEVRPPGSLRRARRAVQAFLERVPPEGQHVLLCHSDADGLASGVLVRRTLERMGRPWLQLLPMGKGESAWSISVLQRVQSLQPAALFVLDLGSRPKPIFPGVPTLLIDHHRPMGVPPAGRLVSSHNWQPRFCTAALAYWLGTAFVDLSDLDWLAALGILGDLGEHATLEPLPQARARYGARILHEAMALVNAARSSASGDPTPALAALLAAREPADIARCQVPEAGLLGELRREFDEELRRLRRLRPLLSERVALIRVRSPYRIHPALADLWCDRLPDYVVLVANEGYLHGRVGFSICTRSGVDLFEFLQAFRNSLDATEFGYGPDQPTGGSLSTDEWKRLQAMLGLAGDSRRASG
jgi:single-stranded-DNA-specific exonuclease